MATKTIIKAKIGDTEIEGPIDNALVQHQLNEANQRANNKDKLQKVEIYLKWTSRLIVPVLLFLGIVFKGIRLVEGLPYLVDIIKLFFSG